MVPASRDHEKVCRFPDFLKRGASRENYVRLSSRKAVKQKEVFLHVSVPVPAQSDASCSGLTISDIGSWSAKKRYTYYFNNLDKRLQAGGVDASKWTNYFHAYRNDIGGLTIQYWRFYAYNTSYFWGMRVPIGNHGGDWEAIHIEFGPGPDYRPRQIRLLGHRSMSSYPWSRVICHGDHVIILAAKGGHTSELATTNVSARIDDYIVQETWSGGKISWPKWKPREQSAPVAELLNLGEKTSPMPGMEFLLYSGLWGSRERGVFGFFNSGYWGPAFNETSRRKDGFIAAWCEGSLDPQKEARLPELGVIRECYASQTIP